MISFTETLNQSENKVKQLFVHVPFIFKFLFNPFITHLLESVRKYGFLWRTMEALACFTNNATCDYCCLWECWLEVWQPAGGHSAEQRATEPPVMLPCKIDNVFRLAK